MHVSFPDWGGPQHRPQNTTVFLVVETPQKGTPNFGEALILVTRYIPTFHVPSSFSFDFPLLGVVYHY